MELVKINNIRIIPSKIEGLDFSEAEKNIDLILNDYKGLVLTDNNISDIKKKKAELNSMAKDLNQLKIKLKKQATAPITEMENNFKSLITKIDNVSTNLNAIVSDYEQEELRKKDLEIDKLINELIQNVDVSFPEIVRNDNWKLKGTKLTDIKEDIKFQIEHQLLKKQTISMFVELSNQSLKYNQLSYEDFEPLLNYPLSDLQNAMNKRLEVLKNSEVLIDKKKLDESTKEQVKLPEFEKNKDEVSASGTTDIVKDLKEEFKIIKIKGSIIITDEAIKLLKKEGFEVEVL